MRDVRSLCASCHEIQPDAPGIMQLQDTPTEERKREQLIVLSASLAGLLWENNHNCNPATTCQVPVLETSGGGGKDAWVRIRSHTRRRGSLSFSFSRRAFGRNTTQVALDLQLVQPIFFLIVALRELAPSFRAKNLLPLRACTGMFTNWWRAPR